MGNNLRRVVVVGTGVVCPIGNDVDSFWHALVHGKNGIDFIKKFDATDFKVKVSAEVKGLDAKALLSDGELRRYDLYSVFASVAAHQAVTESGIVGHIDPTRFGVYVGSGVGGLDTLLNNHSTFLERGPSRVSPFLIPMMIANIASGLIAIKYDARGANLPIVSACSTATHSIGEAYRAIMYGMADGIVCGGSEAPICGLSVAGFTNCMALSQNPDPKTACRPFDRDRDGFVIGEGAGILVLEEYEHAKARGAKILCEVVGYANTCDAHHVTAPMPDAFSGTNAISQVIKQAGIRDANNVYINAHGTSTSLNDKTETKAIKAVFGDQSKNLSISSTKSMHGHMLGATGGVEAVASILSLREGIIPPTINLINHDPECDLDYTPNNAKSKSVEYAISNSLGFGGHNAVIGFKRI